MISRIALATTAALALTAAAHAQRTDLTLGMVLEPPHLDPTAGAAAAIDEVLYANVFEGLTRIGHDGAVHPALAQSWTISDNGLDYTFTLRQGVQFHDGTTFEASDVVFTLDRARAEDSTNAQTALFAPIETVEALDDLTVRVTLSRPAGDFLYNLGWGDAVIVAPESADTNKENPVGTGPFRFVNWQKGAAVNLARTDAYWGEAPALETVQIRFIPDPAAASAALLAGDVHAFPNLPAPESLPQFQADPRFEVAVGSTEGETVLSTNNQRPPFDDIRVRRAIAHAIDRQAIIDGAMFGFGTPIGSHFAPHHPAYVDLTDTYRHDPDMARALLAEAGFADGISATLKLPPPSYARRSGEVIAAQLRAVGIDLQIIPVEWAQWLEQVFTNADYDLSIVSHTEPNDIGIYAREDYYFGYDNAEFDAVIDQLSVTAEEADRYALFRKAQEILARDAVNGFLFQLPKNGVWDARLEGLWENSPVQANDVTKVRWVE
ncbi:MULTISPECIES: ABC transporter substrate-binding protein [unclassified Roseitalea]|uniref:ABC transporter substrate-binding protein n=1 Tax=unclassified Roseitalea TaxID=2639107 RepID=UPI00273ED466|nr:MULTISPECIES: ABC transporter substrate-binding protein [unclassified Roseitalea]